MKPFEPVGGSARFVPPPPVEGDEEDLEAFDRELAAKGVVPPTVATPPPPAAERQAPTGSPVAGAPNLGQRVFVRVGGPGGEVRPAIVVRVGPGAAISCTSFTERSRIGVDPLRNVQPHTLRDALPHANLWAPREEDWL